MRRYEQARLLSVISSASLVAGAVLLAWPAVSVLSTGRVAAEAQAQALAEWDKAAGEPVVSDRPAVSSGFVLLIPSLNVRSFVPNGASVDHLQRYGVGHISWTALPDADGVVGIAGHRTTYGAPFFRLDRLRPGDPILVDYAGRQYTYEVDRQETVRPDRVDALEQTPVGRRIALVTCSPPYSAAFRLIVFGRLESVATVPPADARGAMTPARDGR